MKDIYLMILEAGKPKIKVLADLFPGERTLLGLWMAAFCLCVPVADRVSSVVSMLLFLFFIYFLHLFIYFGGGTRE